MSKRVLTEEQIRALLKNSNVTACSSKSITYSKKFKINAIKRYYEEGVPSRQIFIEAGFDLSVIGKDTPKDRLKKWRKIYNRKGPSGLVETRGRVGRPRTKGITLEDKIKRLEVKVEYLKAENDFLAKLRAKRRTE